MDETPVPLGCPRCGATVRWKESTDFHNPLIYKSGEEWGFIWCDHCEEAFPMSAFEQ